jgi:chorismate synthase
MLSIGWALGFEYWAWFDTVNLTWKTYNEGFYNIDWKIASKENRYGGILWGISTWEDIIFRVAIKPTSSIYSHQKTVDINWNEVDFQIHWRHDPCILPRVVPVIEAMSAIDILDLILVNNSKK